MSKIEQVDVKSKGEVIGQVPVTIYANTKEAVADLGEEKALSYMNQKTKTAAMDALRSPGGTGSRELMKQLKAAGITPEQVAAKLGIKLDG